MKNNYNFKPFDMVLVRDYDHETWKTNLFKSKKICGKDVLYYCISAVWNQCIPYEGNEHLLGTTDTPDRYNLDKNTLFGVKLKPGYVLEFGAEKRGVIFPIKANFLEGNRLAIMYLNGSWRRLEKVDLSKVTVIRGLTDSIDLISGDILWYKPQKQTFTKNQIAEKLNLSVNDFEIID